MKKYLMIFSVLLFVSCNETSNEEIELEAAEKESLVKQRTIDSMTIINLEKQKAEAASENTTVIVVSEEEEKRK